LDLSRDPLELGACPFLWAAVEKARESRLIGSSHECSFLNKTMTELPRRLAFWLCLLSPALLIGCRELAVILTLATALQVPGLDVVSAPHTPHPLRLDSAPPALDGWHSRPGCS
ncbi:hypothetical protein MC885_010046, partial [Smutsia gigantea]